MTPKMIGSDFRRGHTATCAFPPSHSGACGADADLMLLAEMEDEEPPDYYPGDDPYADSADQDDYEEE